jgi:hypothetical protein
VTDVVIGGGSVPQGVPDERELVVSREAGRFTLRVLAVGLLAFGVAGGGYVGYERERRTAEQADAEQAEALLAEAVMLQRRADIRERVDRSRREAYEEAVERAVAEAEAAAERVSRAEEAATRRAERRPSSGPTIVPAPASCSDYSGNRATGCALLLEWGFSLDQMGCLDNLWTRESGWNHLAQNPSSGAYGIPQALPGDKMASYGDDWQTNPVTQIKWGLSYIENRYGTPCGAWSFFQNNNWY